MKLKNILSLAAGACLVSVAQAETVTVSTLVPEFPGNDGISIGESGDIFVNARGFNFEGTKVFRVTPEGGFAEFATGLNPFPVGSVFDPGGDLFVTEFIAGTIRRIAPDGSHTPFAQGIPGAGGLERPSDGNLYCCAYNAGYIAKVTPAGEVSTFATVSGPSGLAYDHAEGFLYNTHWFNGQIFRYTLDGEGSHFVTLPVSPIGPTVVSGEHFENVVNGIHFKCMDCVLVIRCNEDNSRHGLGRNGGEDLEPSFAGHFHIQKNEIWQEFQKSDLSIFSISTLANYFNLRIRRE